MIREFLERHRKPLGAILVSSAVLFVVGLYVAFKDASVMIGSDRLSTLVAEHKIQKAVISSKYIRVYTETDVFEVARNDKNEEILLKAVPIEHSFEFVPFLLFSTVSLFVFGLIWKYTAGYLNKKRSYGVIKATNRQEGRQPDNPNEIFEIKSPIKFQNLAGVDEAKAELVEVVEFMKNPKLFKSKNIHMPRGLLLVGPPGVGKTLLARAVAGEAGVPFFYKSAATFVELYVGVGAKRVSELFAAAKKKAPSIIFIDEIDAIGKRGATGSSAERESTLNQLLVEMDGFEGSSGVIVIAATNRIESLDEALLRPGRFDRRVFVDLPDAKGREEILKIYLKNKHTSCDISQLARHTAGFSGAALASLVNEAAINALRSGSDSVRDADFEAVRNKILYGSKRVRLLSDRELEIMGIYQAGKLFFATQNSIKITFASKSEIRIDGGDTDFKSYNEILNLVMFYLSGRAATKLVFGEVFYQSREDLEEAKNITKNILLKITAKPLEIQKIIEESEARLDSYFADKKGELTKLSKVLSEDLHINYSDIGNK